MNNSDLATIIYSYTFVTGALGSVIWFIMKKAIHHVIQENMEDIKIIKHEVTPNSGGSMNDKINKEIIPMLKELRENQIKIGIEIATIDGKFEQHVREHSL
jgi:hypothetical protein